MWGRADIQLWWNNSGMADPLKLVKISKMSHTAPTNKESWLTFNIKYVPDLLDLLTLPLDLLEECHYAIGLIWQAIKNKSE